ncbi:MAG TPA: hypothetical protein VLZ50_13575 [Terracidiphilus sp.]|nr:hypothetical protein [Terracidiphilus sp.]
MKPAALSCLLGGLLGAPLLTLSLPAQEAGSGFDLRATLTGQGAASSELTEAPRSGSPASAGFRGVAYPTWKMSENLTATGAFQLYTRPYFYGDFSTPGYGAKGGILQASLNYSRISNKGSLLFRAGELSTAFGSFVLRYDDAENPLVDLPPQYGYYYSPVSTLPVAGAQIDATRGQWDGRVQFANSSPANPRSLFARDQYGNWAGGAGYTIRQGFRVGVSAYRGPYLNRQYRYFFPGEENPSKLPAHAAGLDMGWAKGHSSAAGEVQKFVMPYRAIPTFSELAAYGEFRQVLTPRWYVAGRVGYTSSKAAGRMTSLESAAGYRPNRFQLIKIGYEYERYSSGDDRNDNTLAVQVVTTFHRSVGRE